MCSVRRKRLLSPQTSKGPFVVPCPLVYTCSSAPGNRGRPAAFFLEHVIVPHGGPRLTSAYQATTVTSAPSSALKPLSLLGAPIGHMTYWLLPRGVGWVRAGKARIWGGVHPADFTRIPGRGPCRGLDGTSPWPGVWLPGVSALTLTLLGSRRRARGRARVRSAFPMSPALPLWLPGCCRQPASSVLTL